MCRKTVQQNLPHVAFLPEKQTLALPRWSRYASRMAWIALLILISVALPKATFAEEAQFTDLRDIRGADPVESLGASVDFEGTITFVSEMQDFVFVQAGQDAIFVHKPNVADLKAGQRVRVEGRLTKGDLLPIISRPNITLIGSGFMPVAEKIKQIGIEHDCRYLKFEFEILQGRAGASETLLHAKTQANTNVCIVVRHLEGGAPNLSSIAGTRVQVSGVLGLQIDGGAFREPGDDHKITGYRILCNSPNDVVILDGVAESRESTKVASLSLIDKDSFPAGRFLTFGQICVVDYSQPQTFVVSNGSTFKRFQLQSAYSLNPGMVMRIGGTKVVDSSGQTRFEVDYLLDLTQAEFPKPKHFTVKNAIEEFKPDQRISIEGKPLRVEELESGTPRLILGEGDSRIRVVFQDEAMDSFSSLDPKIANQVRVTGVTTTDDEGRPRLVVARAGDAVLVESKASWSRILAIGLGTLLSVCALAAFWIKLLRSQVNQKKRFESIFDNAGCPIIVFNGDAQIIDANQLAADMTKYSKDELRSMSVPQLDPNIPLEKIEMMMAQTKETQEVVVFQTSVITKDNESLPVEVSCRNLANPGDPSKATYIAVFPDISARNEYENELKEARDEAVKANKAKSRFVASMSHELRTPLNGVIGMTQLLETTELTPIQADYLTACRTSGETLLTVIGDVLDFSKMEAGKVELQLESTRLIPFIENIVRATSLQQAARHVDLASFVDPRLSRSVLVDSVRFRQVIFNLIGNAAKFTPAGSITVTAKCTEITDQYADVRFTVADTGVGIPEDKIAKLFEAFEQCDTSTTRQFGGTGLGLTICSQIVDLMGGKIHAQSVEGHGSEFTVEVRLPFADQAETNVEAERKIAAGQRVAVLGMSESVSRLLEEMFEEYQIEASFLDESQTVPQDEFDFVFFNSSRGLETAKKFVSRQIALMSVDGPTLIPVVPANCAVSTKVWEKMGVENPVYKPFLQTRFIQALDPQHGSDEMTGQDRLGLPSLHNRGLRVLICEDVPVNQMFAKEICRRAGIECVVSENGKIGIETLKTDKQFDAVFMDCHMPVMDGFEASRQICELVKQGVIKDIPIIALTASALSGDREKCLDAGMDDYLTKPFEIDQFLEKIHQHIEAPAMTEQTESSDPVFDIEKILSQIDDREFALSIAGQFAETLPRYVEEFQESLETKDVQRTVQIAHRLRGSAGTARAERISGAASKMELTARDGQLDQLQSQLEEILQEFENFNNVYRQESAVGDNG